MIINNKKHNKKYIFYHLYKVAGTSIREILKTHSDISYHRPHITPYESSEFINLDDYFKFAFTRNPWDWQVSLYHYMLRDKSHFQYNIIKDMSFNEYLEWRVNDDLRTQYEWLSNNNDLESPIDIDFVGKFEYLNSDFNFVMDLLGIDTKLPHLNKTPHNDYKSYYDEYTKNLIKDAFVKDIEYFGYNFDNLDIISGVEVYKNKLKNNK